MHLNMARCMVACWSLLFGVSTVLSRATSASILNTLETNDSYLCFFEAIEHVS